MAIKIKVKGGASKTSSAPKKSTAKKGTTTKGRGTTKGRATTRKSTAAKKQAAPTAPRQPRNAAAIKQHESALARAGKNVTSTREAHDDAVNDLYEIAQAALGDDVPMTVVSRLTGVSRQWLYKMGEHRERSNGNKPARRASSAKRSTATKAAAKSTPAKKQAAKRKGGVKISRKRGK